MIPIAKPYLTQEEAQASHDVILTGWVTQGPKVAQFEREFAQYCGANHAVAVSNCTTALHLSLITAGIGPGDEVICPSMSYIATANCIVHAGATPVFAEIDPSTYNLDIADVEKRITDNTKAILLVHQLGMPAPIEEFQSLCKTYGLILIEDAACAIGSSYKNQKIGAHSDFVCFSFHPRKVITTGDGGMITTKNETFAERLRLLRQHGMSVNDRVRHLSNKVIIEDHLIVGYNYRLTDIQAAVGIKQLEKLDWIVRERQKIAQKYIAELQDIPFIRLPIEPEGSTSNYQSFSIYLKPECPVDRNTLMQFLLDHGVASRRGVLTAHRESAYKNMHVTDLPNSEDASDRSIIIPLFVPMSDEDVNYVIAKFREGCQV